MNIGLLLIRLTVGLLLLGHGSQKLFGRFGGHGLDGTGAAFHRLGHRPGRLMAGLAGLSEAGGGLLLAAGLLTPLGAAMVAGTMLTASRVHWANGLWVTNGGYELPLGYGVVSAGLAFTGPGAWSLDALIGWHHLSGRGWGVGAVVLALVAGGLALARASAVLAREARTAAAAYPPGEERQEGVAARRF